jgi:hypothetical protein
VTREVGELLNVEVTHVLVEEGRAVRIEVIFNERRTSDPASRSLRRKATKWFPAVGISGIRTFDRQYLSRHC